MISCYDKLPIGIYLEILAMCEDATMDEYDRQIKVVSLLSGKSEDELNDMQLPEFARLCDEAGFLNRPIPTIDDYKDQRARYDKVTLGDKEFNVVYEPTKMSTAQYVDFQTLTKDSRNHLVEIVACFLIPKGCKKYGSGYDIAEVVQSIREHMSVNDVTRMVAFFLRKLLR